MRYAEYHRRRLVYARNCFKSVASIIPTSFFYESLTPSLPPLPFFLCVTGQVRRRYLTAEFMISRCTKDFHFDALPACALIRNRSLAHRLLPSSQQSSTSLSKHINNKCNCRFGPCRSHFILVCFFVGTDACGEDENQIAKDSR